MADRNGTSLSLLPIFGSRLVLRWSNRHRGCTVGGVAQAKQDMIQSYNRREKRGSMSTLGVVLPRYSPERLLGNPADRHIPLQFRCSAVYFPC